MRTLSPQSPKTCSIVHLPSMISTLIITTLKNFMTMLLHLYHPEESILEWIKLKVSMKTHLLVWRILLSFWTWSATNSTIFPVLSTSWRIFVTCIFPIIISRILGWIVLQAGGGTETFGPLFEQFKDPLYREEEFYL